MRSARSRGWLVPGLGAGLLLWIIWQVGWLPAHTFNATRFILYDQGSYLYAVERLNHGEVLYRDLNWQYGPLAAGWYWLWAQVGGNTPLTLVLASTALMAAAWWLLTGPTREVMGARMGTGWALLGLLPIMSPVGIMALNGPHGALEMLLLAGLAWLLARCPGRHKRALVMGLVLGALQWVRFGPHVVAFLVLGLLQGGGLRAEVPAWREWAHRMAGWLWRVLLGYAVIWLALLFYYRSVLPWAGVIEQLWPSHMVAHYAATYVRRWPEWPEAAEFFRVWVPVLCGVAGAAAWFRLTHKSGLTAVPSPMVMAGLAFGPLYWIIGGLFLFKNDYALLGHLWLVWPGAAVAWGLAWPRWRIGLIVLLLPALAMQWAGLRAVWQAEKAWQAEPMVLPNGQRLWFRAAEARRFAALGEALGGETRGKRLVVFLAGGGVHHFYGTQRVGRHWWYLPEFVRPWEAEAVERAVLQHEYALVADLGQQAESGGDPRVLQLWIPLPADMGLRVLSRMSDPKEIKGLGHVVRIRPVDGAAAPR